MRRVAYVAGPYGAATRDEIERNVRRACAVGQWATRKGFAPVVPHAIGWMGCHGSADESTPGVRETALDCGVALAGMVGWCDGVLSIILRDDRTMSLGTGFEDRAWRDQVAVADAVALDAWENGAWDDDAPSLVEPPPTRDGDTEAHTWAEWCDLLRAEGVEPPA